MHLLGRVVSGFVADMKRLAEPELVVVDHARWRRPGSRLWSGNYAPAGSPTRRKNPFRSAGYCPPRRRASHRSTDRHRRRSRYCPTPGPAGAARDTARHSCPGTRRRGYSGTCGAVRQKVGIVLEDRDIVDEQVAEIAGIENLQPGLVDLVALDRAPVGSMAETRDFISRAALLVKVTDRNLVRPCPSRIKQMHDARGQRLGLAGPRPPPT